MEEGYLNIQSQAGRGMLPRPKRFELLKNNYFIKHCGNVRSGVKKPAPLGEHKRSFSVWD